MLAVNPSGANTPFSTMKVLAMPLEVMIAFGVLMLPYLTLSGGPAGLTSIARFNVVSFPLFVTGRRRIPWLAPSVVAVFGGLLMLYAALFSQWQWIG